VALGVLVVAGCGLAALYLWLAASDTTSMLTAGAPIGRGEVIEAGDLRYVEVATEDTLNSLTDPDVVVGQVAVADIDTGTLITPELLTGGSVIGDGDGAVGLLLGLGEVPSLTLRPGDLVDVVLTPSSADPTSSGGFPTPDSVLVEGAVVTEVSPAGAAQSEFFVSLTMPKADAAATAQAAALGRVRLVAIGAAG
jgi:hypothetical protein